MLLHIVTRTKIKWSFHFFLCEHWNLDLLIILFHVLHSFPDYRVATLGSVTNARTFSGNRQQGHRQQEDHTRYNLILEIHKNSLTSCHPQSFPLLTLESILDGREHISMRCSITSISLREAFKKKTVKRVTLSLLGLEPTYPT